MMIVSPQQYDQHASSMNMTTLTTTGRRHNASMILPPTYFPEYNIECSVHTCPRILKRDLERVFPDVTIDSNFHVLPTFQQANCEMTRFAEETETEKDKLLRKFVQFAERVKRALEQEEAHQEEEDGRQQRYWADYTDPVSGYPTHSRRGGYIYSDVEGSQSLLRYHSESVGGCTCILHPRWGPNCYPATIFVKAPTEVVLAILRKINNNNNNIQQIQQ